MRRTVVQWDTIELDDGTFRVDYIDSHGSGDMYGVVKQTYFKTKHELLLYYDEIDPIHSPHSDVRTKIYGERFE